MTRHGLEPIERFWMKVQKTPTCWLWTAARTTNGYGMFGGVTGRVTTAHRWSYEYHVGPVADDLQVDHLCRVRHCVNPDHLEAVTQSENLRRRPRFRRTLSGRTPVVPTDVQRANVARLVGTRAALGMSQRQFARVLGVTQPHLSRVESGTSFPSSDWLDAACSALDNYTLERAS